MTGPVQFRKASEVFGDKPPRRGPTAQRQRAAIPPAKLRKQIDGLVVTVNTIFAQLRPADALDGVEIATLVKAIEEQARISPRFRRGLESLFSVAGAPTILPVLAIIFARRLARHHVLPPVVDPLGSTALQMMQAEPSEAAAAVEQIMGMVRGVSAGVPPTTHDGDGQTARPAGG